MEKDTIIKTNPEKKNTLKFKGVTKKQIDLLQKKKLPIVAAIGLLGGIGSQYAFMSATGNITPIDEDLIDDSLDTTEEECFDFEVPTNIEFSDEVTDDMSFSEAFKTARTELGDAGFFNWHGSSYHTLYKEEWDALSDDEKQQFMDKIQEHSDFGEGEFNKIEDDVIDEDVIDDEEEVADEEKEEKHHDEKKEEVIDKKEEIIDDKKEIIDDDTEEEIIDEKEEEVVDDDKIDEKEEVIDDEKEIIDDDTIDEKEEVIDDEKEIIDDDTEEEIIDKKEDIIDDNEKVVEDDNWEENIPDEISYDDIIYDEDVDINDDTNEEVDDFVTVDEIGSTEDIIDGLNDGEATTEDDGIAGGDTFDPNDYEDTNNSNTDTDLDDGSDIEYDDNFGEDLV